MSEIGKINADFQNFANHKTTEKTGKNDLNFFEIQDLNHNNKFEKEEFYASVEAYCDTDISDFDDKTRALIDEYYETYFSEDSDDSFLHSDSKVKSGIDLNGKKFDYVEVEAFSKSADANNSLDKIIKNSYGSDLSDAEYEQIKTAVMNANPEIYGTDEKPSRSSTDGTRENAMLFAGDKIVLPSVNEIFSSETEDDITQNETPTAEAAEPETRESVVEDAVVADDKPDTENIVTEEFVQEPDEPVTDNYVDDSVNEEIINDNNEPDNIKNATENNNISIDGKIGDTEQNGANDCWLLTGVNCLSYTEKGSQILDNALEYNEESAVIHTYFGDYEVSYKELEDAKSQKMNDSSELKYASGDDDMILLELGIEKLRDDISSGKINVRNSDFVDTSSLGSVNPESSNTLSAGRSSELIYYLTGIKSDLAKTSSDIYYRMQKFSSDPDNYAVSFGFNNDADVKDISGNDVQLHKNHTYAVKAYENGVVTLTNPWDSKQEIVLKLDDVVKNCECSESADLSELLINDD